MRGAPGLELMLVIQCNLGDLPFVLHIKQAKFDPLGECVLSVKLRQAGKAAGELCC